MNVLAEDFNNNDRLPCHLVLLLDDNMVYLAQYVDKIIKWFPSEIWKAILSRIQVLPNNTKPWTNTKVIIIKPVPKLTWSDLDHKHANNKVLYHYLYHKMSTNTWDQL